MILFNFYIGKLLRIKATTTNVLDSWQNNSIDVQSEIWKSIKKKPTVYKQTNIDIKFDDKKLLLKKQPITGSALVGMQLIQVCIWSVVIVTAENSTLTLPLHRPPAKQTNIQASGRTNKQTKCPSTVSKVLRC